MYKYGVILEDQHGGQSFTDFYNDREKAVELAGETIDAIKKHASDRYFKVSIVEAEHIPGTTFVVDGDDIARAEVVFENVKQARGLQWHKEEKEVAQ